MYVYPLVQEKSTSILLVFIIVPQLHCQTLHHFCYFLEGNSFSFECSACAELRGKADHNSYIVGDTPLTFTTNHSITV